MPTITVNLTQDELTEAVTLWLRQQGYIASSVMIFRNAGDRPGEPDSYGAIAADCTKAETAPLDSRCYVCGDDTNGKRQPCVGGVKGSKLRCPRPPKKPMR